jgi:transcriptional regulator with XRE-family HTH domain
MENISEKTEKSPLPVVSIDGLKIKAIRETKKLTQLYVANVVGVTTDTISRWENNRYPTIKRDNAEKLASALEVELVEILQGEEPAKEAQEIPLPPAESVGRRIWLLALVVSVLIAVAAFFLSRQMATVAVAERRLPRFGAPGAIIPVQIRISRKDSAGAGLIVKERLPAGWRLINSFPPAATGQADAGEVKWLIPTGGGPLTISYTVQVSPEAPLTSTATFAGEIVAHVGEIARKSACGGDRTVTVAGVHWEIMPAYYLSEEMKGLGLDWKTIEAIWSGKGYRWDPRSREFEAIK